MNSDLEPTRTVFLIFKVPNGLCCLDDGEGEKNGDAGFAQRFSGGNITGIGASAVDSAYDAQRDRAGEDHSKEMGIIEQVGRKQTSRSFAAG
jgi:hypothetical protein